MSDDITQEMRDENARRAHPLSDDDLIALDRERARRRALKARWQVFTDDELAILDNAMRQVAFGCDLPEDDLAEHIEAEIERRKAGAT